MAFTPAPNPPNSGNPQTFNGDADAFLGWLSVFASELNAQLPDIASKSVATYGGTANAITLTAGFVALKPRLQVRFRATASNTGNATINLDGLGAKNCVTVTGAALPSGYIRTDADTIATYNGTVWEIDRQIERGSNSNGEYVRLSDGTQICANSITATITTSAVGSVHRNTDGSWTFPAAFVGATPIVGLTVNGIVVWGTVSSTTLTGVGNIVIWSAGALTSSSVISRLSAIGRWY